MIHARSPRARARLLAAAAILALAACSSDGPTPPDGSGLPAGIQAQIDALFPEGNLRASATTRVGTVLDQADAGQTAAAQSAFFDFVDFAAIQSAGGTLLDPNGGSPPTTEDALAALLDAVVDEAGLAIPPLPAAAFTDDGAAGSIGSAGGLLVTPNRAAGLLIPAGALPFETLITIERIPESGVFGDGPLLTDLDQFPRFYRIETFPAGVQLVLPGVVGLCVVDPPDPLAPDAAAAARLRIAHPVPNLPGAIRILPLVDAPFLDCAALRASLSPAAPGRLGGAISSFSPFAAVDPGPGTAPTIVSVTPNPIQASAAGGSETPFAIAYSDPDADIVVLRVVEISDPEDAITGGDVDVVDLATGASGTFTLFASCNETPPARCQSGTVVLDLILVDSAGNESAPFRVTIVFG